MALGSPRCGFRCPGRKKLHARGAGGADSGGTRGDAGLLHSPTKNRCIQRFFQCPECMHCSAQPVDVYSLDHLREHSKPLKQPTCQGLRRLTARNRIKPASVWGHLTVGTISCLERMLLEAYKPLPMFTPPRLSTGKALGIRSLAWGRPSERCGAYRGGWYQHYGTSRFGTHAQAAAVERSGQFTQRPALPHKPGFGPDSLRLCTSRILASLALNSFFGNRSLTNLGFLHLPTNDRNCLGQMS